MFLIMVRFPIQDDRNGGGASSRTVLIRKRWPAPFDAAANCGGSSGSGEKKGVRDHKKHSSRVVEQSLPVENERKGRRGGGDLRHHDEEPAPI